MVAWVGFSKRRTPRATNCGLKGQRAYKHGREVVLTDAMMVRLSGFTPGECFCGFPLLASQRVACDGCVALATRSLAGDAGATTELYRRARGA